MSEQQPRPETIALHGGQEPDPTTNARAVPIYQTAAYAFDSADHGAALFDLEAEGYRYTRIANPTTDVLERRVAALEQAEAGILLSSGMGATACALLALLRPGDRVPRRVGGRIGAVRTDHVERGTRSIGPDRQHARGRLDAFPPHEQ